MSWWRPALAGGLAFAGCFALQALLLEGMFLAGVAQPLAWIAVLAAPPMEEWAKWHARARFRASWVGTGLAFGAAEALVADEPALGAARAEEGRAAGPASSRLNREQIGALIPDLTDVGRRLEASEHLGHEAAGGPHLLDLNGVA